MLKILYWVLLLVGSGLCITGLVILASDHGTGFSASLFGTGFLAVTAAGFISRMIETGSNG